MLEKINVGGLEYKVKIDDETAKKLNGESNWGFIDYCNLEIQVNNIAAEQRQQASLCHEIVHAMLNQAGLQQFNNEDVVAPLGNQLFQLLKNNDFSFIREPVKVAVKTGHSKEKPEDLEDIMHKLVDIRRLTFGTKATIDINDIDNKLGALITQIRLIIGGIK